MFANFQFIKLFTDTHNLIPSPGEKVAEHSEVGRGMRVAIIQLLHCIRLFLIVRFRRSSPVSFADTLPPGEGIKGAIQI